MNLENREEIAQLTLKKKNRLFTDFNYFKIKYERVHNLLLIFTINITVK